MILAALMALGPVGVALATDDISHDDGTLGIGAPYGPANQYQSDSLNVVVTYRITANGPIPDAAVTAVNNAIAAWNKAIDGRQAGWHFELVEFDGSPPSKPNIDIRIKRGGGLIAGLALSSFDRDGFRVGARITISGSAFGLQNDPAIIEEIAMHEIGHALGLGHHSNENDLMGRTVGHADGGLTIESISKCDLDGFVAAHHWLTIDKVSPPHLNHIGSITCPPSEA